MPKVLIPFTTGVEEIELIAVVDILRRAGIKVCMASLDGEPVIGRSNICITPDTSLNEAAEQTWDMIVLPGGLPNANLLKEDQALQQLCKDIQANDKLLAAICAAPATLASFGLLENTKVTSHPSVQSDIEQYPNTIYLEHDVVKDGHIITSRGAGTAVAFALQLVATLVSENAAKSIQHAILA